jgi:hypothetical protein
MPTYDDYTEKTDATFAGGLEIILNDRTDATEAGYCYVTGDDFKTWLLANASIAGFTLTNKTSYEAGIYFTGHNGTTNIKVTLPNLVTMLESTSGLNLDSMYDSAGNHILSTRKGAIVSLTDSTGGTGTDTLNGYTITGVTDSTGGSTADTTLAACTDTTATDQSATINANFAKVAVALNAIVSALNGDNDVSSLRDKIEEILLILRPTTGHALIS